MLHIEMGKFASVARYCRICKLCSLTQIKSEYHFFMMSYVSLLKDKIFGNIHWPSLQKIVIIMSCKFKSHMFKLSMFIRDALHIA